MGKISVRILVEGEEGIVEDYLLPRLDSSMFLYSNLQIRGLVNQGQRYEGVYAAAFDGPAIIGVVAHYWNNNLILQAPRHLAALLGAIIKASNLPIGGLLGPDEQVQEAKNILGLTAPDLRFDETEKLYSLSLKDLIIPKVLASGRVNGRLANLNDVDLLARWRIAYLKETMDEPETPEMAEQSHQATRANIAESRTWVIENAGVVVATSSLNASVHNAAGASIVQVGGVWTPPAWRRQGFGRAAVATSLFDVRNNNIEKAVLFTGESNIAAQKAYLALGFKHIGAYRITFLQQPLVS